MLYPRSKTYSSVLPLVFLFSASASSESTGISAPTCYNKVTLTELNTSEPACNGRTWPDVITISPFASSRLSVIIVPWE